MKIIIKLLIAGLLFGCLAHMHYSYYEFIRVASFLGFVYLAYTEFESNHPVLGLLYTAAAILFNPVAKIHFIRKTWGTIDLVIAIVLIICALIELYLHYVKRDKESR